MAKAPNMSQKEAKLYVQSLADSFQRPLHRYFLRQGLSRSDAEDCVQEVFSRLVRKKDYTALENPQGYVFTMAQNLLKDRRRRARTSHADLHHSVDDAILFCERPDQDRIIAGRQSLDLVKQAILNLPPKARKVFILSRFEELKYREIADLTGMSISAVEKHMMTALRHLAKLRDTL